MSKQLISVVIPVFNGQDYVERCILSLVNQTYKNIEIIIVDDGSADKSGEICDRLAEKYPAIRVIHQKNSGVGIARNVGIEAASGDYITFVDCDDFVEPEMVEELYSSAVKYNSDIVFDGVKYCDSNFEVYRKEMVQIENGMYTEKDIYEKIILNLISCGPAFPFKKPVNNGNCFCLFKSELLSDIRFEDDEVLPLAEDLIFLLYALKKASVVSKTNGFRYCYFAPSNADSRSRGTLSSVLKKRICFIPAIEKFAKKYYKDCNNAIYGFISARYIREITRCMFINAKYQKGLVNTYKLISDYLNLDIYQSSVKSIYGKQSLIKSKLLMFFIRYKLTLILTLYLSFKKNGASN